MAADSHNAFGYCERREVMNFNDAVLDHLGANWYTPPGQDQVYEFSDEFGMHAKALWRKLHVESPQRLPLALKDPRFSLLLPLWESALGSTVGHFVCVRSPILVAQSMAARDGFSIDFGLHLWEAYTLSALSVLAEREVFLVLANDLRDRPETLVQAAAEFAGAHIHDVDLSALKGSHLRHEDARDYSALTRAQYDLWMEICSWGSGTTTVPSTPKFGRQLSLALGSARTAGRRHKLALITASQRDGLAERVAQVVGERDELAERVAQVVGERDELAERVAQVVGERDELAERLGEDLRKLREANAQLVMEVQYARLREDLARSAEQDRESELAVTSAAAERLGRELQHLAFRAELAEDREQKAQTQRIASDANATELSSILAQVFASRSWRFTNRIRLLLGRV